MLLRSFKGAGHKYWGDERVISGQVTVLENNQSSQVNYFYNASEERTEEDDYDYSSSAPSAPTSNGPPPTPLGTLLRKIVTSYATLGGNVVDKPSSVITYNGSGTRMSETDYAYDQTAVTAVSGVVQWTSGQNIGNLTTKTEWLNTGTSPVSTYTYDSTGQLLTKTDPATSACPSGCVTNYSYTDSYTIGTPPGNTNAYLTTLTLPSTNGVSHIEKYKYSYTDGNPTQMIDQNNQTTSFTFNDNFDRLTQIAYPDAGQTSVAYSDSGSNPTITISKLITSTSSLVNVAKMDGLGQTIQTQLTSDPAGTDYVDSSYDGVGNLYTKSNPHRTGASPTDGTTTYAYDALNRTITETEQDGSAVSTSYSGNCSTVTDEASKARTSCSDALGRMTTVYEDPGGLNLETDYVYDALGNLTSVAQKGGTTNSNQWRARSFTFDSLSRLTQSNNPETGTINYTYDAMGNVLTRTDARSITMTMTYDALNRVATKTYSDGTPSLALSYDTAPTGMTGLTNLVGRLVEVANQYAGQTNSSAAATVNSYDTMGRVIEQWQQTPLNSPGWYTVFSNYNLLGDATTTTDAQGVTLTQNYNAAAQITSLTSSLVDSQHPSSLVTVNNYYPTDQLQQVTFGNGLSQYSVVQPRLQVTCPRFLRSRSYDT